MAEHNEIGKIGEKIVKDFLFQNGFYVLGSNYRTRYGEIDVVAEKDRCLHFVEVKSIKVRSFDNLQSLHVKPVDNFTKSKWIKFTTAVRTYLHSKGIGEGVRRQIDLACVYINTERREGKVVLMENVHKE